MSIGIKITGIKQVIKNFEHARDILNGRQGQFYPHQTKVIQSAIQQNHDPSYNNSPAVDIAVKSAETWTHDGRRHINRIMAPLFANYRQYGCGGLKIAELVRFTEADIKDMLRQAADDIAK